MQEQCRYVVHGKAGRGLGESGFCIFSAGRRLLYGAERGMLEVTSFG